MVATSRRNSRRGGATVLVLLAIIPLLLTLGALLTVAVGQHDELEQQLARTSAVATSFSGAQDALSRLEQDRALDVEYDIALNGGIARVIGAPWHGDGADNDENGLVDDPGEENFYSIRSDGWLNALPDGEVNPEVESYHASTDVTAELIDFEFAFGQAIYVDDPGAQIDLNGGAFELSGQDENLDGSPGTDIPRPAIGVDGDPAHLISQVANNQSFHIVGNLPNPAIGQTAPLEFDDYLAMLEPLAAMKWTNAQDSYRGTIGNLQARRGLIAHASGDLKLHGNTSGAGVLIVEGDLEIDGQFTFAGVILVRGNVSVQGGGGAKELHGAMLIWGEEDSGPAQEDLEINGTVQVTYSVEGLDIASTSGGVRVLFWREQ